MGLYQTVSELLKKEMQDENQKKAQIHDLMEHWSCEERFIGSKRSGVS